MSEITNGNVNPESEGLTDQQIGTALLRSISGTGAMIGGFLHIPVATAIVKSNLQNFWKFLGLSIVAGDGMECIRMGVGEFRKAVEAVNGCTEEPAKPEVHESEENAGDAEEICIDLHEVKPEE